MTDRLPANVSISLFFFLAVRMVKLLEKGDSGALTKEPSPNYDFLFVVCFGSSPD